MSGNPNDSIDNEPPEWLIDASNSVRLPATLLIMVGVLSLVLELLAVIQLNSLPGTLDQIIETIEADPQLPQDEKDKQIDFWTALKDAAEERTVFLYCYILSIVCSVTVVIGGIKMLRLSGPYMPIIGSVIAMLPCALGGCCCLGMPIGMWALIVLSQPDIRRAMAPIAASGHEDEQDGR